MSADPNQTPSKYKVGDYDVHDQKNQKKKTPGGQSSYEQQLNDLLNTLAKDEAGLTSESLNVGKQIQGIEDQQASLAFLWAEKDAERADIDARMQQFQLDKLRKMAELGKRHGFVTDTSNDQKTDAVGGGNQDHKEQKNAQDSGGGGGYGQGPPSGGGGYGQGSPSGGGGYGQGSPSGGGGYGQGPTYGGGVQGFGGGGGGRQLSWRKNKTLMYHRGIRMGTIVSISRDGRMIRVEDAEWGMIWPVHSDYGVSMVCGNSPGYCRKHRRMGQRLVWDADCGMQVEFTSAWEYIKMEWGYEWYARGMEIELKGKRKSNGRAVFGPLVYNWDCEGCKMAGPTCPTCHGRGCQNCGCGNIQ